MFTQKRLRGQAKSVAFGMLKESLRGARGALQAPPDSLVRLQKIQGKYFMSIILEGSERLKIRCIVMAARTYLLHRHITTYVGTSQLSWICVGAFVGTPA